MKLHFTLGYHPKGDGQTKRVNQTLEQYLHAYCVRATAVRRDAVLAGDPKGLDYYVILL